MQLETHLRLGPVAVHRYEGYDYVIYEKDGRLYARPGRGQKGCPGQVRHLRGAVDSYIEENRNA